MGKNNKKEDVIVEVPAETASVQAEFVPSEVLAVPDQATTDILPPEVIEKVAAMDDLVPAAITVETEVADKVVDEETAKTYQFSADIVKLDTAHAHGRTYDYSKCMIVIKDAPLKLTDDSGKVIGSVVASVQGNTVVGQFFLDYSTPERLNLETGAIAMYVYPVSYSDAVELSLTKVKITKMYIQGVQLTDSLQFPGAVRVNKKD